MTSNQRKIISTHTNDVYQIKTFTDKTGRTIYYTKFTPWNRNSNGKVSATTLDRLESKIINHYQIENKKYTNTVLSILEKSIKDLCPETQSRHIQLFNKYFVNLSNIPISCLTENDIRNSLQKMIDIGIKAKAFNNAISTLNKINDYCNYYHIACLDIRDVISCFRKYKLAKKRVFISSYRPETELAFTEAEAKTLMEYTVSNPDYHNLAIAVLLVTGLRTGELLALTESDINMSEKTITVNKIENSKDNTIIDSCKDSSDRTVFMNTDALIVFNLLLNIRKCANITTPFLFLNNNSKDGKLHLRAIDNRLRKLQNELGFTKYNVVRSAHDCRRTYASIQYIHNVDIKTIQSQLGHSSPLMTWDYIKNVVDINTRERRLEMGCFLNQNITHKTLSELR